MTPKPKLNIAVLAGDGIGAQVTRAALPVFEVLGVEAMFHFGDIGWSCWQKEGNALPQRTWALVRSCDATLVGAITSKPEREAREALPSELRNKAPRYVSPLIELRQGLNLFANVRPCYSLCEAQHPFHFCIIRENTEGLYAGLDYAPLPPPLLDFVKSNPRWSDLKENEASCALRLQTRDGLVRLFSYAFEYANRHNFTRVTFADKPNVLRQSSAFSRPLFEAIALQYPHIRADILNVDAVAMWIVRRPQEFGVIVAENMFGDILSDVGAAVMGGLGFAPSANIGSERCYFEPVHGSGPHMRPNSANPSAMFLTISMLLEHCGFESDAKVIRRSVEEVLKQGQFLTYDAGGQSSTEESAAAILQMCARLKGEHG